MGNRLALDYYLSPITHHYHLLLISICIKLFVNWYDTGIIQLKLQLFSSTETLRADL
jgi:hypothetical protein